MTPRTRRTLGYSLLLLAGLCIGFSADLTRDWRLGSSYRVARDDFKFIGLLLALVWLLLLPGVLLVMHRRVWYRVVPVAAGFAVWILLSQLGLGLAEAGSVARRATWLGAAILFSVFIPFGVNRGTHTDP